MREILQRMQQIDTTMISMQKDAAHDREAVKNMVAQVVDEIKRNTEETKNLNRLVRDGDGKRNSLIEDVADLKRTVTEILSTRVAFRDEVREDFRSLETKFALLSKKVENMDAGFVAGSVTVKTAKIKAVSTIIAAAIGVFSAIGTALIISWLKT